MDNNNVSSSPIVRRKDSVLLAGTRSVMEIKLPIADVN